MSIAENIAAVRESIATACLRANRKPDAVTLVAVSKTHPAEQVVEAIAAGLQHFGENRVEESAVKIPAVNALTSAPITWHMIGHLQSRKAREVPALFQWVHSVDNVKLASKLSAQCAEQEQPLDVLLEINVSGEAAKYGFQAAHWEQDAQVRSQLWEAVRQVQAMPGLHLRGLMTMAPIVEQMEATRPVFASLAKLRAALAESLQLPLPDLSMGMTDDYPVAIEEGATLVRIGRAIFGERHQSEVTTK